MDMVLATLGSSGEGNGSLVVPAQPAFATDRKFVRLWKPTHHIGDEVYPASVTVNDGTYFKQR